MIGTHVANYRIEERLGEGGMGVVYKAIDINLDRPVAVKFLSSELSRDPSLIERFQTEARSQANLNHTNIATLYNFLKVDENWVIVMEYVDGENLEQMIRRRGVIQYPESIPLFKQTLLGIGFAHRMGIIHRDIKPANIMMNKHGIVKVMDFGIAKALSGRKLTRTGVSVGTVAYMSPEQIRGGKVDIRSDIYSLGVTLYEMLTAHLPFDSDSDYQVQFDHVNTPPTPLSLHYPYIPGGIEAAVLRSMEKNSADRFQTVEEFGAALDRPEIVPEKYRQEAEMEKARTERELPGKAAVEVGTDPSAKPASHALGWASAPNRPASGVLSNSRHRLIIAAVAALVLLVVAAVAFWPKSRAPEPHVAVNSGGGSTVQQPSQGPQGQSADSSSSGGLNSLPDSTSDTNQAAHDAQQPKPVDPGSVALQKARRMYASGQLLDPSNDNALYWARQASLAGNHAGPAMENQITRQVHSQFDGALRERNLTLASTLLSKVEQIYPGGMASWHAELLSVQQTQVASNTRPSIQSPAAPNATHTYSVRHRHVDKLGIFNRNNAATYFSSGILTISSTGGVQYRCTNSPGPNGCEPTIELESGDIKQVKFNSDGGLHLATFGRGNYDFYGSRNSLEAIQNELIAAKH
jgi:serine/threonine protein kinase